MTEKKVIYLIRKVCLLRFVHFDKNKYLWFWKCSSFGTHDLWSSDNSLIFVSFRSGRMYLNFRGQPNRILYKKIFSVHCDHKLIFRASCCQFAGKTRLGFIYLFCFRFQGRSTSLAKPWGLLVFVRREICRLVPSRILGFHRSKSILHPNRPYDSYHTCHLCTGF